MNGLACALALLTSATVVQAAHIQVFLLGGQSNMLGQGTSGDLPAALQSSQTDVLFYTGTGGSLSLDTLGDLQPGSGSDFGPEVTFGRTMADANPSQSFGLIKHAVGTTNLFSDWAAGSSTNIYADFRTTVAGGLAEMASVGYTTEIVGMLWTQGERDARLGRTTTQYESDLNAFIADIRGIYGASLPFYFSQLSNQQTNLPETGLADIRQAQANVAAGDPNAFIIGTDSFGMKNDDLHFDSAGQMALGEAFANAVQQNSGANPEPSTWVLAMIGMIGLNLGRWRRDEAALGSGASTAT